MTAAPDRSVAELIGELVALVAGVVREDEERRAEFRAERRAARRLERKAARRRAARARRQAAEAIRLRQEALAYREAIAKEPMLPVAACLASAVAHHDEAAAAVLLSRPRTPAEWRQLAEILAAAADPARIKVHGLAA